MADTSTAPVADSQPDTQLPKLAPFPFNKAVGDIVLRSSDNVDFRVRSAILAEASPVFEDMFSLPLPTAARSDDPITLEEDSRTLETLLRICYPLASLDPLKLELDVVDSVLTAALKYDIDAAVVLMQQSLMRRAITDPIRVYCIACRLHLETEARDAAKKAAEKNVVRSASSEELQGCSAGCYHRLLVYSNNSQRPIEEFTFCEPKADKYQSEGCFSSEVSDENTQRPASFPFDCEDADVTLISSDNVTFRVYSNILRLASPVLAEMIGQCKPSRAREDKTVEMKVPETSQILRSLLSLIYPCARPEIDNADQLLSLALSGQKYKMANVVDIIRSRCHTLIPQQPFAMYFLASQCDWHREAEEAAKIIISWSITALEDCYIPLMEGISASVYLQLLNYHKSCGVLASKLVSSLQKETESSCDFDDGWNSKRSKKGGRVHSDTNEWTYAASTALSNRPCAAAIAHDSDVFSVLLQIATSCRAGCICAENYRNAIGKWKQLIEDVTKVTSTVQSPIATLATNDLN